MDQQHPPIPDPDITVEIIAVQAGWRRNTANATREDELDELWRDHGGEGGGA